MKTVAFFNHKGGVGKTTVLFNMAIEMGRLGHRVLMVDFDGQANLSAISLDDAALSELYDSKGTTTVAGAFAPLVSGAGDVDVQPTVRQIREDVLWLLPGDIQLADFEGILPGAWTEALAGLERGFRVSSAPYRLVQAVGEQVGADFAFLDLGPNVGPLNRVALLSSDFLLVPMAADLFSVRALPSVGQSLAKWVREWSVAVNNNPTHPFALPPGRPHVLGYVSQQFNIYRGDATAAFQEWIDRIPDAFKVGLLEPMKAIEDGKQTLASPATSGADLGTIKNFHSLVPHAQELRRAIFELEADEVIRGAQINRARASEDDFRSLCQALVERTSP